MERLTEIGIDGNWKIKRFTELFPAYWQACNRLAAYEDTGLEPEELREVGNDAFDLGYQTCLHDRFGLTWDAATSEAEASIGKLKAYSSIGTVEEFSTLKTAVLLRRERCKWIETTTCSYKTDCGREVSTPISPKAQGWTTCMFCGRGLRGESHDGD